MQSQLPYMGSAVQNQHVSLIFGIFSLYTYVRVLIHHSCPAVKWLLASHCCGVISITFVLGSLQVKERLLKILTFWADRKLYDKDTMQQLEAALLSGDPNAMLQAPAPKPVSSTGHATVMQALLLHRHQASACQSVQHRTGMTDIPPLQ